MSRLLLGILVSLTTLTIATPWLHAQGVADAEALKNFKHVRMLFWALDARTGSIRGFSDVLLRPGDSVSLNPMPNYPISFSMQSPRKFASQFLKDADTPTLIPIKAQQPKFEGNWAQSLLYPGIDIRYEAAERGFRTITLVIPVGSLNSPAVAKWIGSEVTGTHAELEALLLAIAREGQIDVEILLHCCVFLTQSDRLPQWVALSHDKDQTLATLGLVAATRFGDVESLDRYCEKCLKAKFRTQNAMVQLMSSMPGSDKLLDTMLLVAALPDVLVTPGSGSIDGRLTVARAIQTQFADVAIQARGQLLIADAMAKNQPDLAERLKTVLQPFGQRSLGSPSK